MVSVESPSNGTGHVRHGLFLLGVSFGSMALANLVVALIAALALALETGAGRKAGMAIDIVALLAMVAVYSAVLVGVLMAASARGQLPGSVWPALAAVPLLLIALVLAAPEGTIAPTTAIVTGLGALVAWPVSRRRPG